jgi:membrane protein
MRSKDTDGPAGEGRFGALFSAARERMTREQGRWSALLAKYENHPLINIGLRTYQRDREVAGSVVGAAIAFRLFLFFVPLLLFAVGLAGFVSEWVGADDASRSAGISGALREQIRIAFEQAGSTRWLATFVGLVGMATTGRTLSKVMVASSALAWRLPLTNKASVRVIGALVGLVAGVTVLSVIANRVREEFGIGITSVSFLAVFALYAVAWTAITSLLPRGTRDPSVLLPGAVLVAATIVGMQAVSQFYLPGQIGRASELYGAVGATIVTLGWFFILGRVIVIALALNAVVHERLGSISQFVFSLPVLRILPRRSAWIRRFFGLDEERTAPR